jgi:lipoic acid synthetase
VLQEVALSGSTSIRGFPPWLKKRLPSGGGVRQTTGLLQELGLETVCKNAHCPNLCECYERGTATFLILGNVCTRNCRFCAVTSGDPEALADDEPERVAEAVRRMGLRHVVITSVTRDDLPDGGSWHYARTIRAVREAVPGAVIEVLTPDFGGDAGAIGTVVAAGPDVYNHNVETVSRLYDAVRPQADYRQSLQVLATVKELAPQMATKSGLMVGLGETPDEVGEVLRDLRGGGCELLTIGQYLSPSEEHHPVVAFVPPAQFEAYEELGRELEFSAVASGPFVRSSYMAEALFERRKGDDDA